MNNRRMMLKTMLGSVLGFLGFSKTEEVKAEDLGTNYCSLNGLRFDINNASVRLGGAIIITAKKSLVTQPFIKQISNLVYSNDPISGEIRLVEDKLRRHMEFEDYRLRYYGINYASEPVLLPAVLDEPVVELVIALSTKQKGEK